MAEKIRQLLRALGPSCAQDAILRASSAILAQPPSTVEIVAKIWSEEYFAGSQKELALLYVANDVMQKTRKEGTFTFEFGKNLENAFKLVRMRNKKILPKVERLVKVWRDRSIYSSRQTAKFLGYLRGTTPTESKRSKRSSSAGKATVVAPRSKSKKRKMERSSEGRPRRRGRTEKESLAPSLEKSDLESLFRHLSHAKTRTRKGREILSNVETVIAEGNLPPEFVQRLVLLEKQEFEGFAQQVINALKGVNSVCAGLRRSVAVQKRLKEEIDAEMGNRERMLAETERALKEHEKLGAEMERLKKKIESDDEDATSITFEVRSVSKSEKNPSTLESRTSVEEDVLLDALAPEVEPKRKDDAEENSGAEAAEDPKEDDEADPDDSGLVWDPRIRDYATRIADDDEEDWRN